MSGASHLDIYNLQFGATMNSICLCEQRSQVVVSSFIHNSLTAGKLGAKKPETGPAWCTRPTILSPPPILIKSTTHLAPTYAVPSSAAASAKETKGNDDAASVAVDVHREARVPPLHIALSVKGFLSPWSLGFRARCGYGYGSHPGYP
jgi:hypothetical protein